MTTRLNFLVLSMVALLSSCDSERTRRDARCDGEGDAGATCDDGGRVLCAPACPPGSVCAEGGTCLGTVAWSTVFGGGLPNDLALQSDGTIVAIKDSSGGGASAVMALGTEGEVRWTRELPQTPVKGVSAPALGPHGDVFVTVGFTVVAMSATGEPRWALDVSRWPATNGVSLINAYAPTIASDGTVLMGYYGALDDAANLRWTYSPQVISLGCDRPVAIGDRVLIPEGWVDGRVGKITAFDPEGRIAWALPATDHACAPRPLVDGGFAVIDCDRTCMDASLIVASLDDGRVRKRLRLHPYGHASLEVVLPDGRLVARARMAGEDDAYKLLLLDPARAEGENAIVAALSTPEPLKHLLVGDDGLLYVVAASDEVWAMRLDGSRVWTWKPPADAILMGPVLTPAGCLALPAVTFREEATDASFRILDWTNQVLCLRSTAHGLAASPWPRTNGGNGSAFRAELR